MGSEITHIQLNTQTHTAQTQLLCVYWHWVIVINTGDVLGKCCSGPDVQITSVVTLLNFSFLKCNEKYIYTLYICVNIFFIYCVIYFRWNRRHLDTFWKKYWLGSINVQTWIQDKHRYWPQAAIVKHFPFKNTWVSFRNHCSVSSCVPFWKANVYSLLPNTHLCLPLFPSVGRV